MEVKCDICKQDRPESELTLVRHDISHCFRGSEPGRYIRNVWYCKHNEECKAAALRAKNWEVKP